MKYIQQKMVARIKELSDKGWDNSYRTTNGCVVVYGKYKGEIGNHTACVTGLSDGEIREIKTYGYYTSQEFWNMSKNHTWGVPSLARDGNTYMM